VAKKSSKKGLSSASKKTKTKVAKKDKPKENKRKPFTGLFSLLQDMMYTPIHYLG
jgi:hypothetical protein